MTLRVNALTGFGGGGGAPVAIVGSVAGNVSTTNATTHAIGNINVGTSSSDKNVIMGITWEDFVTVTLSSMTVGGVSLTIIAQVNNTANNICGSAICVGDISSINGSQAISVTFSANAESAGASGVAVTGLNSLTETMVDTDFQDGFSEPVITALAATADGIVFAVSANNGRTNTAAWSSLTERADVQTDGFSPDHRHSSAWDLGLHSANDETITWSGGDENTAVGAGFR